MSTFSTMIPLIRISTFRLQDIPCRDVNIQYHDIPCRDVNTQYHGIPCRDVNIQYHGIPCRDVNIQYHDIPCKDVNIQYHDTSYKDFNIQASGYPLQGYQHLDIMIFLVGMTTFKVFPVSLCLTDIAKIQSFVQVHEYDTNMGPPLNVASISSTLL